MRLPARGFMALADGQIVWTWDLIRSDEPDLEPPLVQRSDGTSYSVAEPDATIISVVEELEQGDIQKLGDLSVCRFRQQGKNWTITRRENNIEVDHPFMDVLRYRQAQKAQAAKKHNL